MLQVFCDASERAYSTVGNLQGGTQDGELTASLDTSKSRVDPLKKMTLPRLEPMGAVTLVRLASHLIMTLKIEQKQARMWMWPGSTAIRSATRHRSGNSLTQPEWQRSDPWPTQSHRIDEKINLAHLPNQEQNRVQSQLWWNGPGFLSSPDKWRKSDDNQVPEEVQLAGHCTAHHQRHSTHITSDGVGKISQPETNLLRDQLLRQNQRHKKDRLLMSSMRQKGSGSKQDHNSFSQEIKQLREGNDLNKEWTQTIPRWWWTAQHGKEAAAVRLYLQRAASMDSTINTQ